MTVIVKSEPYKSLKTIFTGEESNVKILDFDDYKIASLNNFRDFASNEEWVIWCNFLEKYEHTIDNIQQNAQIIDTIPNELFFSESFNYSLKEEIIRIIQDYEIARKDNSNYVLGEYLQQKLIYKE